MKYIIVMLPSEDYPLHQLASGKQFESESDAKEFISHWAECWQSQAIIVECLKGLTY